MSPISIAVLMTCFNRKDSTLRCLSQLFSQKLPSNVHLKVYLVDDASTDGTRFSVQQKFPDVKVLMGDGNLFWNGGMRLAFGEALKTGYDFYLWLNDDTYLFPSALDRLLNESSILAREGYDKAILVGATQDPATGALTYGGVNRYSWWYPLKFVCPQPLETAQKCDTMHGNCVLIPNRVADMVGNLDSIFVHHLSDFDYGFRANKKGCSVWLTPGFVGTCSFHEPDWRDKALTLKDKLRKIRHPKGLSLSEWRVYAQRHAGPLWPVYWLAPYIKLMISSFLSGRIS